MIRGTCAYCNEPVRSTQKAAFRVHGFELERDQGGANRILGRERDPDWIAHAGCAEQHAKIGDQMSLLA